MFEFLNGTPFEFVNSLPPATIGTIIVLIVVLIVAYFVSQRRRILCPYCITIVEKGSVCSNCKEPLHKLYQKYSHAGNQPELISVVGFSGHGKTVYLASLLYALTFDVPKSWADYFRRSLDENGVALLQRNMDILQKGNLPDSTRMNFPKPNVQHLNYMPRYSSKVIALYDPAGETFESESRIQKYGKFITYSRAVLFLISLSDLKQPYGQEMHRLLEMYTLGLTTLNGNSRRQHLVVVFTKADAFVDETFRANPEMAAYLASDDAQKIGDLSTYLSKLQSISDTLEHALRSQLNAANFVGLAEDSFKSVSYTIVSALGSPPDYDPQAGVATLSVGIQPRRVIDPLLWVLEKT